MTSATAPHPAVLTRAPYATLALQTGAIMLLCLLDALLTLHVLTLGAEEWNPIMAGLLEHGAPTFVGVKLLWTLVGCGLLILLGRHRAARRGLTTLLLAYVGLTGYHLFGQAQYALLAMG